MRFTDRLVLIIALIVSAACAVEIPETHYYRLQAPRGAMRADGIVMMVDDLEVDTAYDDPRIVYRTSVYHLKYYEYHRWTAPPSEMVADFLRSAYESTGRFERVVRGFEGDAPVALRGRVLALEEVDRTKHDWVGNIELELWLEDTTTGRVLWTRRMVEREPLDDRHPEGLARAITRALTRVVERTAPEIARAAATAGTATTEPRVAVQPQAD